MQLAEQALLAEERKLEWVEALLPRARSWSSHW